MKSFKARRNLVIKRRNRDKRIIVGIRRGAHAAFSSVSQAIKGSFRTRTLNRSDSVTLRRALKQTQLYYRSLRAQKIKAEKIGQTGLARKLENDLEQLKTDITEALKMIKDAERRK